MISLSQFKCEFALRKDMRRRRGKAYDSQLTKNLELNPSQKSPYQFTDPGGMQGLNDLGVVQTLNRFMSVSESRRFLLPPCPVKGPQFPSTANCFGDTAIRQGFERRRKNSITSTNVAWTSLNYLRRLTITSQTTCCVFTAH